jgi:hypothetical protein
MFTPFFLLAAQSPTRQASFRRTVFAHLLLVTAAVFVVTRTAPHTGVPILGHLLLILSTVEGAALIGWRLTQLPRSQALEFLLVSPVRPQPLFLAETAVGVTLLALVTLSVLPVLLLLVAVGALGPLDPAPLLVLPFLCGTFTGLGLTVWAYEPRKVRLWGERVMMALILVYLLVGVLAAENLKRWLEFLPESVSAFLLGAFQALHTHNPFGIMQFWLSNPWSIAWPGMLGLMALLIPLIAVLVARGAARLQGHFHERHYDPARDVSREYRPEVGNRPLSWWAVKRVSEYGGQVNLWLAGGFCCIYALYIVAGNHWPSWLGVRVFQLCDQAGGVPVLTSALVVLAAVPAAFQYGLWDSHEGDRVRRLELLLLTELGPTDYWDAAAKAAWKRGRGYFEAACVLWGAALVAERLHPAEVLASVAAGVLLWSFYFALGFRAFARGAQAVGLGMTLTVLLPIAAAGLAWAGWPILSAWIPPGMVYAAGRPSSAWWIVGPLTLGFATVFVARSSLKHCDAQLRRWYDSHHGATVAA